MINSVFVILILLNIFSQGVHTQTTTPPPLTFVCSDGKMKDIGHAQEEKESLLVEYGSGKLCHITADDCLSNWKDKGTVRLIFDKDEKNKNSKFVAGNLYYYELQCKSGYYARDSATAFKIISTPSQPYFHEEHTQKTPSNAITVNIFKEQTELKEKVHVGDPLVLKITSTGTESHSLKPINCTAHQTSNYDQKYLLWDKTQCRASDPAIMKDNWIREGDTTIAINMFAFRFVDSLSITIECTVYVCPSSDENCGKSITNCMPTVAPSSETQPTDTATSLANQGVTKSTVTTSARTTSAATTTVTTPISPKLSPTSAPNFGRRRRRFVNRNDYKETIASTTFTVVDIHDNSSGCTGLSSNTLLYFTSLLVCMFIIRRD